jgi:hypothetical protein
MSIGLIYKNQNDFVKIFYMIAVMANSSIYMILLRREELDPHTSEAKTRLTLHVK